jgi:hypothetical protein
VTLLALVCTGESFELAQLFGDDVAFRSGMYQVGPSQLAQMVYVLGQAGSDRGAARCASTRARSAASRHLEVCPHLRQSWDTPDQASTLKVTMDEPHRAPAVAPRTR